MITTITRQTLKHKTSASIVFDGPQIIADGTDAVLTGSVFLGSTQGQGIELHGGSAYMRSLGIMDLIEP